MMTQMRFKTGFAKLASIVFVTAVFCVSTSVVGNVASQSPTQADPDNCDFNKADAKLNKVYQRVLAEYRQDKIFIVKLRAAQRAWLAFRDAHIASIYPASDPREYGTVNRMCRCMILVSLTEVRTNELQRWVDGTIEGDVCAGSVKIRRQR